MFFRLVRRKLATRAREREVVVVACDAERRVAGLRDGIRDLRLLRRRAGLEARECAGAQGVQTVVVPAVGFRALAEQVGSPY